MAAKPLSKGALRREYSVLRCFAPIRSDRFRDGVRPFTNQVTALPVIQATDQVQASVYEHVHFPVKRETMFVQQWVQFGITMYQFIDALNRP